VILRPSKQARDVLGVLAAALTLALLLIAIAGGHPW
jgi:hypothetical protein